MNLKHLYQTLHQRKRPEDVAQLIHDLLGPSLSLDEEVILLRAAKGSLRTAFYSYTSMLQDFAEVVGAKEQIATAIDLFDLERKRQMDTNDPAAIESFILRVSPLILKKFGENNFVLNRLNKTEREASGLELSKRQYNKRWRLLKRLEQKLKKVRLQIKKLEFQKLSKHGLAHHLSYAEFSSDYNTAAFIAYFTARSNKRSEFTNQSQERAFDEISEMLFNRCEREASITLINDEGGETANKPPKPAPPSVTNWWAIAHVYPAPRVLEKLSDAHKGELLSKWTTILGEIADLLGQLWNDNDINREKMMVRKGNDSTTWNNTAGAWNKARDNWMNLIHSLGMAYVLEEFCFGKVMRLMAADVMSFHLQSGGQLDPNTQVWNLLPLPWKVLQGEEICTKDMIVKACKAAGLDPVKSGWIAPSKHGVATFKPTPELVHGVTVANPYLAKVLRMNKYFSGK